MDVEEDGVDVLGLEGAQRLGAGGRAVDGADPVIPAEQEGQFLDGGQLVIGDEDVNHGSRVLPQARRRARAPRRLRRRGRAATWAPAW